jgi:hypothetical protein
VYQLMNSVLALLAVSDLIALVLSVTWIPT